MVDDHAGYKQIFGWGIAELARGAHARRRFYDSWNANGSPIAHATLARLGELYGIEAKLRDLDDAERERQRTRLLGLLLARFKAWLDAMQPTLVGNTARPNPSLTRFHAATPECAGARDRQLRLANRQRLKGQITMRISTLTLVSVLAACSFLLPASSSYAVGTTKASTLLGTGKGINHVVIAVRSLDGAAKLYNKILGFTVTTGGTFPDGTANDLIQFKDHTYLELFTVYDREKASKSPDSAATMQFLEKHQGASILGLEVSSASATADYLRGRGFDVAGPMGGSFTRAGVKVTPRELWKIVAFSQPADPGLPVFFIEYNRNAMAKLAQKDRKLGANPENTHHANGATRLYSVWIAVKNLADATKAYERVGFIAGSTLELTDVGAQGREIEAGAGKILLVEPQSRNGSAGSFAKSRESFPLAREMGESVMGVGIEVKNLAATRSFLEARTHRRFATYAGPYGKSLLVPPRYTRGVWMEFFQKKR